MHLHSRARKIFRDVISRKARTLMVSMSIFIGVLGVVTLTTVSDLIISQLSKDLQPDRLAMVTTWNVPEDGIDGADLDHAAALAQVRSFVGVASAEQRALGRIYWREPDATGFIEGRALAFSEPYGSQQIEPVSLAEGRYPVAGDYEIAVERRMADNYGLRVGDTLSIRLLSQLGGDVAAAGSIPEAEYTITGIVFHPYRIGDWVRQSIYTTFDDYRAMTGSDYYTNFLVRFSDFDQANRLHDALERLIDNTTNYQINGVNVTNPDQNPALKEAHQWTDTLVALAIIAMLVSSFLVVTVITTIVVEQRKQIGVMKSLGATRFDNFRIYAGIAVVYGVLGTVPGVLLGIPAGYALAAYLARFVNMLMDNFMISTTAVLLGCGMGVLMPFLAALIPVLLGTRVSILEAITDLGISTRYGYGPIARLVGWLPFPPSIRQALANIYQRRGRLFLTWLTLTLAVAAFMGVTALFMSVGDIITRIFDTFSYEVAVIPVSPDTYDYDAVGALLQQDVEGLNGVYPAYYVGVDILLADRVSSNGGRYFVYLSGFDPRDESITLTLSDGRGWQDDPTRDGIVITTSVAQAIGKGVGDTVLVQRDDQLKRLDIIGIDTFPVDAAYTRWETAAELGNDTEPDRFLLRYKNHDLTGADVDRQIGEIRELLLQHGIVAAFGNQRAFEEENADTVVTLGLVFNIASGVMAAVGAIGLLSMLFMSVFERQREIGVMRSVGARSRNIVAQFLTEGLLVGVIAWLVGLPISIWLTATLADLLPLDEFDISYAPLAAVLGLVGMLVIATAASLWPSLSAARKTVSNILRYQ